MAKKNNSITIAHVTHEAVEQIGGIGTVLAGLMTSPVYQQRVGRSIVVGPIATHITSSPEDRLGHGGKVLYSSIDGIDRANMAGKLRPVEWAFNVALVYGTRTYHMPGDNRTGEAEVLLIDVFRTNPDRLAVFKLRLWQMFGLDSSRYENLWDYEEYVRLAEPAYYALLALLTERDLPCFLFSHEFMGIPTAMQAILEGQQHFRTVFYAHECATARRLVEDHPGHDVMFYNVLDQARGQNLYAADIFGSLDHMFRHALVSRTHLCDGLIAVGDRTRDEMRFLNAHFAGKTIDLVYNGVPRLLPTLEHKLGCRAMLAAYAKALLGHEPDVLLTHVTRPVISKGLWRDLRVCDELDRRFAAEGRTAVLFILTSGGGVRRPQDILTMEEQYNWPRCHREGYPDLVGPELELNRDVEAFNAGHEAVQVVLVNQFGWSRQHIGRRLPAGMDFSMLRAATDVEFGMATYEPFGISPVEPLGSGALCVISEVCGCDGFVQHATAGKGTPNVITAHFTRLPVLMDIEQLKNMTRTQRDAVEDPVARKVAAEIIERLPRTEAQHRAQLKRGQALVNKMGWDQVAEEGLLPMLERVEHATNGTGPSRSILSA